jgi:3-polyprenyl-4-hydroxybenzoate decarboxylase
LLTRGLGIDAHFAVSRSAERAIAHEIGADAIARVSDLAQRHHIDDVGAVIASGSSDPRDDRGPCCNDQRSAPTIIC